MPRTPDPNRLVVIDPRILRHVLAHPARRQPWSQRELASALGCSKTALGQIVTGERDTVDPDLAERFADAVGCHIWNLFATGASTESEDAA